MEELPSGQDLLVPTQRDIQCQRAPPFSSAKSTCGEFAECLWCQFVMAAYPVQCVLPFGRYLEKRENGEVTVVDIDENESETNDVAVLVQMKDSDSLETLNSTELCARFGFIYSNKLMFLHENLFRNSYLWSIEADGFENAVISRTDIEDQSTRRLHQEEEWRELLRCNLHCKSVYIKFVDDNSGYGLFTTCLLPENTFIGEYVGIVDAAKFQDSNLVQYVMSYPSCDGNVCINASKHGNITRFINHAPTENEGCNVKFHILHEKGLCNVICVTTQPVPANTQLLVDYGNSFWLGKNHIMK